MSFISEYSVPLIIFSFVMFGIVRKVKVFDAFVEGAKEGLECTIKIMPSLVGLMVGISMFRASGAMDIISEVFAPVLNLFKIPKEIFPLAVLRPVSGSGSIAIVTDILNKYGPDSLVGKIASVMMGSTETTFYTLAVYFGCVGIKKTRHTLKSALIADFVGIILSVFMVYLLLQK